MSRNFKIREPDWSAALWARVKRMFGGLDTRVTTLEQSGGEANVINSISFNGNNVPPDANKNVAIAESDPTVPSWAKASTKPAYTASEVGAKAVQTAVSDPTASGTSVTFIDGITQNAQGVIAPTKKTVRTMTGATSGAAGAAGLVPQPSAGDDGKYLKGDGTWGTPGGSGEMNVINSISFNGSNVPPDGNKNVALTETDPTVPAWAKNANKPAYTASEVGAPSTDGTGASGTWGISVSGNSANVTGVVAIANGGTGQSGTISPYVGVSNIVAAIATDWDITEAYCAQWGKLINVKLRAKRTGTAITTPGTYNVCTLKSYLCPLTDSFVSAPSRNVEGGALGTNGEVNIIIYDQWGQNSVKSLYITYILA